MAEVRTSFCVAVAVALVALLSGRTAVSDEKQRMVSVSEDASLEVAADIAQLELVISTEDESLQAARKANDERSSRVLKFLADSKVAADDIKTSKVEISTLRHEDDPKTYYEYEKGLILVVRDMALFEQLFNGELEAGVNEVEAVHFDSTRREEFLEQTRRAAVEKAKKKAAALATAFGQRLGKPADIRDHATSTGLFGLGGQYNGEPTFPSRQVVITTEVSVDFLLEDEVAGAANK